MEVIKIPLLFILLISSIPFIFADEVEDRDSEFNGYKYTTESTRDEKSYINKH